MNLVSFEIKKKGENREILRFSLASARVQEHIAVARSLLEILSLEEVAFSHSLSLEREQKPPDL
jgi:hypothetical protein